VGMFDKESRQVRAKVVPTVRREVLQKQILDNIAWGSTLHTDEARSYKSLKDKYVHETVNHAYEYVRGNVSTNSLENFWSLLKRNLKGTYVAVEPFHLDRYLAEQCFRFNTSKTLDDGQRFTKALSQIAGKRLTLAEVTGKVGETGF
jgi:ISXO2-like transposase domain